MKDEGQGVERHGGQQAELRRALLTAQILTGRGLVLVCSPGVGDPSRWQPGSCIASLAHYPDQKLEFFHIPLVEAVTGLSKSKSRDPDCISFSCVKNF